MCAKLKSNTIQDAKEAVFRLLRVRFRSEKEIRDRLIRKGFGRENIDGVVRYFKDIDLINDRRFTRKWIASRLAKPFGANRIRFELKEKGVEDSLVQEELEQATKEYSEFEAVAELAKRQTAKYRGIEAGKMRQRVYAYLCRRGFTYQTVMKAVRGL
jgi:regulatory protein